mmetsp:Transcript_18896/g.45600  ORF Transcript_18896/g.45600 Transcript_18896/m.45600 type:complete len:229 (-) Transcript_18896:339-1025(-)
MPAAESAELDTQPRTATGHVSCPRESACGPADPSGQALDLERSGRAENDAGCQRSPAKHQPFRRIHETKFQTLRTAPRWELRRIENDSWTESEDCVPKVDRAAASSLPPTASRSGCLESGKQCRTDSQCNRSSTRRHSWHHATRAESRQWWKGLRCLTGLDAAAMRVLSTRHLALQLRFAPSLDSGLLPTCQSCFATLGKPGSMGAGLHHAEMVADEDLQLCNAAPNQ